MSIFERLNSDKAEATVGKLVFGSLVNLGIVAFVAAGAFNFDNVPQVGGNQPGVQQPYEPIVEEPISEDEEWIDPGNTDGSDGQPPVEETIIEEPAANLINITEAAVCDGDLYSGQGISNFAVGTDAWLPVGSTMTMPTWLYETPGSYNPINGLKEISNDGTNVVFEVIDDEDDAPETLAGYYQPTSIEYVSEDFNDTVVITLPEGYEADSESTLVYELNINSPHCEIEIIE